MMALTNCGVIDFLRQLIKYLIYKVDPSEVCHLFEACGVKLSTHRNCN